jgi:hypothetical protein
MDLHVHVLGELYRSTFSLVILSLLWGEAAGLAGGVPKTLLTSEPRAVQRYRVTTAPNDRKPSSDTIHSSRNHPLQTSAISPLFCYPFGPLKRRGTTALARIDVC